jgi:hypothetical protein
MTRPVTRVEIARAVETAFDATREPRPSEILVDERSEVE